MPFNSVLRVTCCVLPFLITSCQMPFDGSDDITEMQRQLERAEALLARTPVPPDGVLMPVSEDAAELRLHVEVRNSDQVLMESSLPLRRLSAMEVARYAVGDAAITRGIANKTQYEHLERTSDGARGSIATIIGFGSTYRAGVVVEVARYKALADQNENLHMFLPVFWGRDETFVLSPNMVAVARFIR